jgi:glycosyltransferase involved in cell wall biosynthesis
MFPPRRSGLSDHTDILAGTLAPDFPVTVLTSTGNRVARSFAVEDRVANWHDGARILQCIQSVAPVGPILWQFVPHMYGRGGVNFAVSRVARELRMRQRRQIALVHEIAAAFSWWPHRSWYACAHRLMWRGLSQHVNELGISTEGWLKRLEAHGKRESRFFLAPSPSNISVVPGSPDHARHWREAHELPAACGVLGYFGTIGGGKRFDWVLSAWRSIRRSAPSTALVVVGDTPIVNLGESERPWYRALGHVAAPEASAALQAMQLLLLPFADGVSERRSTFMAALAHGIPVVTTFGPATGPQLRSAEFYRGSEASENAFMAAAANAFADAGSRPRMAALSREIYAARYDWPCLVRALVARFA